MSFKSLTSFLYFSATKVPETSISTSFGGKKLNNNSLFKILETVDWDSLSKLILLYTNVSFPFNRIPSGELINETLLISFSTL